MTTEARRSTVSASYSQERVDTLPFNTEEKTDRYRTERFLGGIGLNWYECDPTLQRAMRYYLTPDDFGWAEPRLVRLGALMGGPVAERAEVTDKNPPHWSSSTAGVTTSARSPSPSPRRPRKWTWCAMGSWGPTSGGRRKRPV
jgi:hypothetical protein